MPKVLCPDHIYTFKMHFASLIIMWVGEFDTQIAGIARKQIKSYLFFSNYIETASLV